MLYLTLEMMHTTAIFPLPLGTDQAHFWLQRILLP